MRLSSPLAATFILLAAPAPALACSVAVAAHLLPETGLSTEVPTDVAFTFAVSEDSSEPFEVHLFDEAGADVAVDVERVKSVFISEYRRVQPQAPLPIGSYSLRASPGAAKPGTSSEFDFEVTESASHPEFPDVELSLASEKTNSPSSCASGAIWRSHLRIEGADLPPIAIVLNEYELRDGKTVSVGSYPSVEGSDLLVTDALPEEVECVTPSVVLATGAQVQLSQVCADRGGCSTTGNASSSVLALAWVVFWSRRRARLNSD